MELKKKRNQWTPGELELLRENYPKMSAGKICRLIPGHTRYSIKNRARRMGIVKTKGRFPESGIAYLKANYPAMPNSRIAETLGVGIHTVARYAGRLGLKKDAHYIRQLCIGQGQRYGFQKGNVSFNKGKKISAEMKLKCANSYFKKGHVPANALPDLAETMDRNGYMRIKPPGSRKATFKHWWIWEQANGRRPPGSAIRFRDGNRLNCTLENLYIISRGEHMRMNSIYNWPEELRTAMRRIGNINRLIKEKK